jgi:hypothetical protein
LWDQTGCKDLGAEHLACLLYEFLESFSFVLGSGLIDHIQKMTMAAMAIADMKVWAQRSYRV